MAEEEPKVDPTLVERWIKEQQKWQRTSLAYLDAMVKDDDFLVHLGNAMRGSLLAGKPYPTAAAPATSASGPPTDDRIDQVLFLLHQLEGQFQDLRMSVDELRESQKAASRSGKKKIKTRAKPKASKSPASKKMTTKARVQSKSSKPNASNTKTTKTRVKQASRPKVSKREGRG